MPSPMLVYGALALTVLSFSSGWAVRGWRCDAAQTSALDDAAKAENKADEVVAGAASGYEDDRATVASEAVRERVVVQEIYRDVEVPADCAVPADAVGVLTSARERANAAASGELGSAVRGAAATAEPAD